MASIRKRNGKFQVQIRRTGYPTIAKSFVQKKDAQEWARLREIELDRDELAPCRRNLKTIKLSDLVERYVSEVLPEKRSQDVETIVLNSFLKDSICKKLLSHLSTSDFADYRDRRLTEITPISLKRQLAPLHNMFEIAREEWEIPIKENPLSKLKLKATDNRRERRLKDGELERLLEAGKNLKNPYVIPVILFALETAMRRGEILSLRCWDQIDTKRSSATILESKNGYSRTIPLSPTPDPSTPFPLIILPVRVPSGFLSAILSVRTKPVSCAFTSPRAIEVIAPLQLYSQGWFLYICLFGPNS
jgi:integrase